MFLVWQVQGPCSFLSEPAAALQFFPRPEDDSLELQAGFQHPSHLILPLLSDSVVNTQHIMQLAKAGALPVSRTRTQHHFCNISFKLNHVTTPSQISLLCMHS